MDYARALGATPVTDDYRIIIELTPNDRAQADEIIAAVAPGGRFVAFHAARGMRIDLPRWPVESFAAIGDALGEAFDLPVLLTGTEEEARVIARIGDAMRRPHAVIAGETSLRSLAALLARADLPMRWRPLGERVVVVEPSFPCPPWCRKETCKTFDCYRALDPEAIVAAARAATRMTATVA